MKAYNDSLYSGWSTTSLVLLVCMARSVHIYCYAFAHRQKLSNAYYVGLSWRMCSSTMAICCSLYHKRLEKKRGGYLHSTLLCSASLHLAFALAGSGCPVLQTLQDRGRC
eukprot:COSAG01_NODE_3898_length_5568_cov_2.935272_7_plen_110_part_00